MRRRDFITVASGVAAAWPFTAFAQQERGVRRVGVLIAATEDDPETKGRIQTLQESFRGLGWTESRNLRIEYRITNDSSRLRDYAVELVRLKPDVIVSSPTPATLALKRANTEIPIVFVNVADPVGSGFVASIARPGGMMTGFTNFEPSLGGKWLDLLREIVPGLSRVGFLYSPNTAASGAVGGIYLDSAKAAATRWRTELIMLPVDSVPAIGDAIGALAGTPTAGLVVNPNVFTMGHRRVIMAAAAKHRVPAIYPYTVFPEGGGLLSYGIEVLDSFRGAAVYADRILKGEKPAELPVQAPIKFEMAINLKAAKQLGLIIPESFLLRADKVIE